MISSRSVYFSRNVSKWDFSLQALTHVLLEDDTKMTEQRKEEFVREDESKSTNQKDEELIHENNNDMTEQKEGEFMPKDNNEMTEQREEDLTNSTNQNDQEFVLEKDLLPLMQPEETFDTWED